MQVENQTMDTLADLAAVQEAQQAAPTDEVVKTPSDSATQEEVEQQDDDQADEKKSKGYQKRVDKLTRERSEAQRERDYWRDEALKNRASSPPEAPEEVVPYAHGSARPDPDDFETNAEYIDAVTDWKIEQKEAAKEAKQRAERVETEQESKIQSFQGQVKEFVKTHADYDEVLRSVDDIPLGAALQELVLNSENGAEMLYELAKDHDELARINQLSPLASAREFGKFEANIEAKKTPKDTKPVISQAPKPINPVSATGESHIAKDPSKMSDAEWYRDRKQRKN